MLVFIALLLGLGLSLRSTRNVNSLPINYILMLVTTIFMINCDSGNISFVQNQIIKYSILSAIFAWVVMLQSGFESLHVGRITFLYEMNQNQTAIKLAQVFVILSVCVFFEKNNKLRLFLMVVELSSILILLFLTGSRTSLLASIVTIIFVLVLVDRSRWNRIKLLAIGIISLGGFVLVYVWLLSIFPEILNRFSIQSVFDTGGSGRMAIWNFYFKELFPQTFLIGIGFDSKNFVFEIGATTGRGTGAHNLVIEILTRTGVVGLLVYGSIFWAFIRMSLKARSKNYFIIVPLSMFILMMLIGVGENTLTTKFLWLSIGLGYWMNNIKEPFEYNCQK